MYKTIHLQNPDTNLLRYSLEKYGIVLLNYGDEIPIFMKYQELMKKYFRLPNSVKNTHVKPELSYQIGLTPAYTEIPILSKKPDPKERFMYIVGHQYNIKVNELKHFESLSKSCGEKYIELTKFCLKILGSCYNLPKNFFEEKIDQASNILATTCYKYPKKYVKVVAGKHRDVSFITLHIKATHPGLYLFSRKGKRFPAIVPKNCILIQAGAQLEYMTSGKILAGYHEVVAEGCPGETRVANPFFVHLKGGVTLETIPTLKSDVRNYPPVKKNEWLFKEIRKISLSSSKFLKSESNIY